MTEEQDDNLTIVVNGREKRVASAREITFTELIALAFGEAPASGMTSYTVTYTRGPWSSPEGSLVAGGDVRVDEGMVFNVTRTDKS